MVTKEKINPPDVRDRCDSNCGAKALVRVLFTGGLDLVFCGHHYDKLRANLSAALVDTCDTRETD